MRISSLHKTKERDRQSSKLNRVSWEQNFDANDLNGFRFLSF